MARRSKRLHQAMLEEDIIEKNESMELIPSGEEEADGNDDDENGNESEDDDDESGETDEDDDDDDGIDDDDAGGEAEDDDDDGDGDEDKEEDDGDGKGQEGEEGGGDDNDDKKGKAKMKAAAAGQVARKTKSNKDKENTVPKVITGVVLTLEEMVQGSILYLLLLHHRKLPIKRADVVKNAMNGQLKSFPEVMDKIKEILDEKFGINLVGVEESRGRISGYSSYILVSKYPMLATECAAVRGDDVETKRCILYIILAVIFMLGQHIEEDLVWKILVDMQINSLVCKKRDDLRRFLKHEYVSSLYLNAEEVKETEQIFCRYSWGLRAEKEFSKYAILKFVSKQFPEKKPYDFTVQYGIVIEQEKEIVEADRAELDALAGIDDDDLDEEAPAQTISFGSDGKVDTVEMRGGDPSSVPSSLSGMKPSSPLLAINGTGEMPDPFADTPAPSLDDLLEGEPMEDDDHDSGSDSEAEGGSAVAATAEGEGTAGAAAEILTEVVPMAEGTAEGDGEAETEEMGDADGDNGSVSGINSGSGSGSGSGSDDAQEGSDAGTVSESSTSTESESDD